MEEITAEYLVEEIKAPVALKCKPVVTVAGKTDMGRVRENNEDKHEFYLAETEEELARRGHVFVVCDGMGGHEAGQVASELACKTFIDVYRSHPAEDATEAAASAVHAANRFIMDVARAIPSRSGMGTTLVALILVQDQGFFINVGDSRGYRLRGEEFQQVTNDHTWIEETVVSGQMSREEAENHPYKHVITRALGTMAEVLPDLFTFDPAVGDVYYLCSDGVTNHVSNERIGELMESCSPSQMAWKSVNEALEGGGSDNATALCIRLDGLERVEETNNHAEHENM